MAAEILTYLRIVKKRWWLIFLLFVVTTAVILLNALREKPVYQAFVKLQVIAAESQDVSLFAQTRTVGSQEEIVAVQVQFEAALSSYYVAWQTINDLNLGISAAQLLDGLTVSAAEEFMGVIFTADNPMQVEAIATKHVENAFKYYAQLRAKSATVSLQFIREQLSEEEKALTTAQSELLTFKTNHNLDSLPREITAIQDQLRELRLQRAGLVVNREKEQAIAAKYQEEADKAASDKAASDKATSGKTAVDKATEKAPIDYANLILGQEFVIAGIRAQEAQYDKLIAQQEAGLVELLKLTTEYDALVRTVTRIESNYNFLADKENEARLKENQANNVSFIQIVEPARMPDQPVPSRTPKMLAVGAVVSLIAGVVLAFVLEFLSLLSASAQKGNN